MANAKQLAAVAACPARGIFEMLEPYEAKSHVWFLEGKGAARRPARSVRKTRKQDMKQTMLLAATCASLLMLSAPHANASTSRNEFDIVMVAISPTTWSCIKYNTGTGEAWIAQSGKWMPIEETAKIPKGQYLVKMTALSNDWAAIRFEKSTGQSWQCRGGVWVEITHATAAPVDPPARTNSPDEIRKQP